FPEGVNLFLKAFQPRIRCKTLPVKLPGRVWQGPHRSRTTDFLPVALDLAPEIGPPGLGKRFQAAVALLQPAAEGCLRYLAVTLCVMTGIFIVHVPQRQRRVIAKFLHQAGNDLPGMPAVVRAVWAHMPPRAVPQPGAVRHYRQALRVAV